jgi:hypothetical protein
MAVIQMSGRELTRLRVLIDQSDAEVSPQSKGSHRGPLGGDRRFDCADDRAAVRAARETLRPAPDIGVGLVGPLRGA